MTSSSSSWQPSGPPTSSTFQWDCSVAARPPEGTVSWLLSLLALPPASPPAGRGRPAGPGPASPFLAPGPASPWPGPEGHCHRGRCSPPPPPAMLGPIRGQPPPSLSPFPPLPPFQAQGMLILPFGGQRWSLELSPPGLPSPDFQPLSPRGTSSLPGNRKPRVLAHSRGSSLPHLPQDLVF